MRNEDNGGVNKAVAPRDIRLLMEVVECAVAGLVMKGGGLGGLVGWLVLFRLAGKGRERGVVERGTASLTSRRPPLNSPLSSRKPTPFFRKCPSYLPPPSPSKTPPHPPEFFSTWLNNSLSIRPWDAAAKFVSYLISISHFGTKIDESEIQNHEISLAQHFYTVTKIKLDPGSELGSFDLGSGKMVVQQGSYEAIKSTAKVHRTAFVRTHRILHLRLQQNASGRELTPTTALHETLAQHAPEEYIRLQHTRPAGALKWRGVNGENDAKTCRASTIPAGHTHTSSPSVRTQSHGYKAVHDKYFPGGHQTDNLSREDAYRKNHGLGSVGPVPWPPRSPDLTPSRLFPLSYHEGYGKWDSCDTLGGSYRTNQRDDWKTEHTPTCASIYALLV
ncbi:hypothetical protein PR048_032308 [Dryococelus australis]|uniref:Uncharacterized protein n=1 Tax=Dryococelus australis TaxID=614101 RepID=A0ABQ9G1X3_9NEOP|nr:hypothetical protein PR048_032308 [Dryococelus australis]